MNRLIIYSIWAKTQHYDAVFRAKLKKLPVLIRILIIQTSICKEMCKKLLVLTKSCRSRTDGPALVSNTVMMQKLNCIVLQINVLGLVCIVNSTSEMVTLR